MPAPDGLKRRAFSCWLQTMIEPRSERRRRLASPPDGEEPARQSLLRFPAGSGAWARHGADRSHAFPERPAETVRRSDSRSGLVPGALARADGQHGRRRSALSILSLAPMRVRRDPGQGKVARASDGAWADRRGLVPDGAACRCSRGERGPGRQRDARRGLGSRWA